MNLIPEPLLPTLDCDKSGSSVNVIKTGKFVRSDDPDTIVEFVDSTFFFHPEPMSGSFATNHGLASVNVWSPWLITASPSGKSSGNMSGTEYVYFICAVWFWRVRSHVMFFPSAVSVTIPSDTISNTDGTDSTIWTSVAFACDVTSITTSNLFGLFTGSILDCAVLMMSNSTNSATSNVVSNPVWMPSAIADISTWYVPSMPVSYAES